VVVAAGRIVAGKIRAARIRELGAGPRAGSHGQRCGIDVLAEAAGGRDDKPVAGLPVQR
jgi:hypothetical protein